MKYYDKSVPPAISKLIEKMLDEDCLNPSGTAEKAVSELLDRAVKMGREQDFKGALRFWKNAHAVPESVIWQWFNGVFRCTAKGTGKVAAARRTKTDDDSGKHKSGRGGKAPNKE